MTLRLGSVCTGYGGLDLAAEAVLGPLEHTWHAEIDPHASRVLAHHWPGVPNLGDLTAVDWTRVEPVDVYTAGYPCQPLSLAGRRAGLSDERWIWDDVIRAIRVLRPRLVLLENVAGHLSLGFGRVLGDLAAAGFDAEWGCFRASDVGAPHRRERVFIAAWPADCPPDAGMLAGRVGVGGVAGDGVSLLPTPRASDTGTPGRRASEGFRPPLSEVLLTQLLPTPTASERDRTPEEAARRHLPGRAMGRSGGASPDLSSVAVHQLLPTPTSRDHKGHNQRGDDTCLTGALLPTPNATDAKGGATRLTHARGNPTLLGALLPTPTGQNSHGNHRNGRGDLLLPGAVQLLPTPMAADGGSDRASSAGFGLRDTSRKIPDQWGNYAPAIDRWEAITGRPAPSPTEPGKNGQPRLAPPFVEWLMGLPAGWVTDHLGRGPALKCLGNGVVPQQAAHAYTQLLAHA
ncbi:MAG TPA: DNA cytosine methyltransferase [Micromonosporaceae bacterium]